MSEMPMLRMPSLGGRWRLVVALLLASVVGAVAGAQAAADAPFELEPGLLVDPASSTVFLMSPEGGIDAVDLGLGMVRWHRDEEAKPLSLAAGRLVAQAEPPASGVLRLVVLDAADGRLLLARDVDLPEGVSAPVRPSLGRSFAADAELVGSALDVAWTFAQRPVQGMPTDVAAARPRTSAGALLFDPASGATTPSPVGAKRASRPAATEADLLTAVAGRQFLSADGRHILASDRLEGADGWNQYRWTIYTRSGERLGSLGQPESFRPFHVTGSTVVFVSPPSSRRVEDSWVSEPRLLRAVDLTSGLEQWRVAVRDLEYRGPFPP